MAIKLQALGLPGAFLIDLQLHEDVRGQFTERFVDEVFENAGLPGHFAQDNLSRSFPNVLRGLHYQQDQGKLVSVLSGEILDVIVDVRPDSASFGKHAAIALSGEKPQALWIPTGFAHGFCVMSDRPADVFYKVTTRYNPSLEKGIRYNDPALAIQWPVSNPILSERDKNLPFLTK